MDVRDRGRSQDFGDSELQLHSAWESRNAAKVLRRRRAVRRLSDDDPRIARRPTDAIAGASAQHVRSLSREVVQHNPPPAHNHRRPCHLRRGHRSGHHCGVVVRDSGDHDRQGFGFGHLPRPEVRVAAVFQFARLHACARGVGKVPLRLHRPGANPGPHRSRRLRPRRSRELHREGGLPRCPGVVLNPQADAILRLGLQAGKRAQAPP
mmetsp:Transcript_119620/g.338617  ORF Transcript_119620/g.338617 Transcript_119620/m.338617 type:complete len:208 (-) Transcript_119620:1036-1659(-)